ncbi:hypothetical protein CAPTEDRAFT_206812 [Capitella teleta]|uniref:Uncharacterized protein n=1 Tax=Capitella teleta TaxID=283909 RepID=R7VIB1_CAPTE|nr:hypothetical protein CAPTEDRAFT_206812 [Capitella teleta]|eukprot:ELU16036.1 hypothetical protein CAPTEDRAFT_206812 [Capitella teleta]
MLTPIFGMHYFLTLASRHGGFGTECYQLVLSVNRTSLKIQFPIPLNYQGGLGNNAVHETEKLRLGCGGSNTNKTVCNSLLELMTVSAQLGFNAWGFNNSMHRYLQKKSIQSQPVLMKWDIAVREAAFYEVHRLTRFHKRGPFDMTHVTV